MGMVQRVFRVSGFLCSMYICYEYSMYVSHIRIMGMVQRVFLGFGIPMLYVYML